MDFSKLILNTKEQLLTFQEEEKKIFATTSFQTNSVVLLHIISQTVPNIPVYFINTGYLFAETLTFKDELVELLSLNVVELTPAISKFEQLDNQNKLLFTKEPNKCCEINKVKPLEKIKEKFDVWVSGVRSTQTKVRANFKSIQETKTKLIRYHPIIEFSNKAVYDYINYFKLPKHPLEMEGYVSVGCLPCTEKYTLENSERSGRWTGQNKVECGLHLES